MGRIFIFGDSTTQEYGKEYFPQQGWAYGIKSCFDLEVVNVAHAGNSLKSFLFSQDFKAHKSQKNSVKESEWGHILSLLEKDDFMIMYWAGINDMLQTSSDQYIERDGGGYVRDWQNTVKESYIHIGEGLGTHELYTLTSSLEEYKQIFLEMVKSVKQKGCIPILVRGTGKYYQIGNNEKNVISVVREYSRAVEDIAKIANCDYLDVGSEFESEFASIGYKNMIQKYFLCKEAYKRVFQEEVITRPWPVIEDNVHYNVDGARRIQDIFVHKLSESQCQLKRYLRK